MTHHRRLALLGLPPSDRHLIETLLLGSAKESGYVVVHELEEADLIICNADDGQVVRKLQLRNLNAPVLLIGERDAGSGWPVLPRPLSSQALVAAMSTLAVAPVRPAPLPGIPVPAPAATGVPVASWRPPAAAFQSTQPFSEADFPSTRQVPLSATRMPAPTRPDLAPPVPAAGVSAASPAANRAPAVAPGFQATVPFAALETTPGDTPEQRSHQATVRVAARPAPPGNTDSLAQDVLMWRDGPAATKAATKPVVPAKAEKTDTAFAGPASRSPGGASLSPASGGDSYWTSSLASDSLDHPTRPQALGGEPSASILLVGGPRLAGGSLIKALRGFGHRVDHAPDGGGALSRLAARDYDFVFLDHAALGISTLSLCRTLLRRAASDSKLKLHVVVIAGQGSWLQHLLARSAGCDAWMIKPLVKKRLQNYLRKRILTS